MNPNQVNTTHQRATENGRGKSLRRRVLSGGALLLLWITLYGQLDTIADFVTYSLLRLPHDQNLSLAVEFFVYEVPKVLILLTIVVFVVGIVRSFFTPERTRRLLSGRRESTGNILAALLGVVTPFCSCSAVPLFIGFVTAGIPLGVTLSFLISAPMVNEIALVMLFGLFGWKVAALYMGMGLLIAMLAGWVIGRLKMEKHVEAWVYATSGAAAIDEESLDFTARIRMGRDAVREIVGKVWLYVVLGIAVGSGIHGYVPANALAGLMGKSAWWSVPLSVVIGVPMYSNAAGIIPVVQALLGKGAALGTVLAFMMSVIGLSLPEAIILRKVLKPRLLAVFFGVVAVGIMLVGYLFNYIM
jgi:uncharacterized membrane protein YraQ (UPF0718 family)